MTDLPHLAASTAGLPCRTDPEPWFSDYPAERHTAARSCDACPLLAACRSYATETRQAWGVWGGVDFTVVETFCGTERGHQIHARNGEFACGPCLDAHAALVEGRRRKRLGVEHGKGGTVRGYELHRMLGESACAVCMAASGRASAERRARARSRTEGPRVASVTSGATEPPRGAAEGVQGLAAAA